MKCRIKRDNGFTLIQIIVAVIIVGILAAIAIPNLYTHIIRSQAVGVISSMYADKTQLESCFDTHIGSEATSCAPADPTTWQYALGPWTVNYGSLPYNTVGGPNASGTSQEYTQIRANYSQGGYDTVNLFREVDGTWQCQGTGFFAGVC